MAWHIGQQRDSTRFLHPLVAFRLPQKPRILCVSLNEVCADQLRAVISRQLRDSTFSHLPKMKNPTFVILMAPKFNRTPQRADDLYALFLRRFFIEVCEFSR